MKTAMQELLDWVNSFDTTPFKPTRENYKEKIWQLLQKEKQQIIDAFNKGLLNGMASASHFERGIEYYDKTGEQYYNETFKQ